MGIQSWRETITTAQTDGTAVTNTTPLTLLPSGARIIIPSNFWYIGKAVKITALGRISNIVTTPGTLTLDVRTGPSGTIVCANGGAMALNIVAKTNVTWSLEWYLTCRAIGSGTSANLMHVGKFMSESVIGSPLPSAGGSGVLLLPSSAPAIGTGWDSTAANVIDLFATWSVNNAGNTLLLHQYMLEAMN